MEAIAHRLSSEAVNVVWLLIHSVITSRFSSSRESCMMYRDDHDRELTDSGANSVPLLALLAL